MQIPQKLVKDVGDAIQPSIGHMHFTRSLEKAGRNIKTNGTFGLIDTGSKKLLVTCWHVWDGFLKRREKTPELRIAVNLDRISQQPNVFDLKPIHISERLDMATFDIAPLLPACRGRAFFRLDRSPAPDIAPGEMIFFSGYPGRFRSAKKNEVEFGRIDYALKVADVSGQFFIVDVSNVTERFESEPRPSKNPHGGISGTPCFVFRDGLLRLVGFAIESGNSIMRFTHARCLAADGSINDLQ